MATNTERIQQLEKEVKTLQKINELQHRVLVDLSETTKGSNENHMDLLEALEEISPLLSTVASDTEPNTDDDAEPPTEDEDAS